MPATASVTPADLILPSLTITKGLYERLLEGVPAEKFARKPEGVDTNHPAFILGHLALYPAMVLSSLGQDGVPTLPEDQAPLFEMGAECKDDPDGSVYPPMKDLVAAFNASLDGAAAALPKVDPARWNESPPEARSFGGVMTSMAALANFILVAHPMMHSGQISAWRRCMGMPAVSLG